MTKHISLLLVMALLLLPAVGKAENDPSTMTVRQLILQKTMVSVRRWSETDVTDKEERKNLPDLTEMNESVRAFFAEYQPGGVILFANNTRSTEGTYRLIQAFQSAVTDAGAPAMLVTVDQEGGYVTRLAQGTSMPGNMALGAIGKVEDAKAAGAVIGEELSALGFTMDCGPSLDVNNNPLNPVINVRSFGESPSKVAELGVAFMQGLTDGGVIPIVKHFPGHGDTQTDSHSALPVVTKTLEEIESTELVPFQAAIDAGVQVIMTAHIQYPALDDTTAVSASTGEAIYLPATLSKQILTHLLREKMGFEGVIMTDAMNMDAIALHFGAGEAMVRAFEAGVDLALMPVEIVCPGDIALFNEAVGRVEAAVESGRLTRAQLEASVRRIMKVKEENGVLKPSQRTLEAARQTIASEEHRQTERRLACAAVTVIANDDMLPIRLKEGDKLLLIAAYGNELTSMRFAVERLMKEGKLPAVELETYSYQSCTAVESELQMLIDSADAVVLDSEISSVARLAPDNWQSDMPVFIVDALNKRGIPYCDVSMHLVQDAALLTQARGLVAAYNPSGMSDTASTDSSYAYGPNLPAAIDVIFGAGQAQGTLPVTVYALNELREIQLDQVLYPCGWSCR
ncbi:MAG: glycoside hydrolase family 3 protein [Eubacteriales bacterium]|nr:glycoside hydrolase family 3 protein [Eubacteriales bacterium]